ncbi:MAG TPA: trigger factor [Myxococcota bacterium]
MHPESAPQTRGDTTIRASATRESAVAHRLEVRVEADRVRKAFDRAYRELARQVRVKGFRPGKAPRSVLERLYGASVAEQLESTLIRETLPDAIEQTALEPVTTPDIDAEPPRAGEDFTYVARIEVAPEIELGDLSGLSARRPRVDVPDADVDRELAMLRERQAPVVEEPEGTQAATGHILSIDFVGRIDGEPFEGGRGREVELELGSGRFITGFEDQLEGACAGEDREVRVTFPADYANAERAGKEAVFDVHVGAVKRRQLAALDDEFAKDLGDFSTLEELRERIRSDLHAMRERAARAELRRTLMDSLIERTPFEVPAGLVEQQLERELGAAAERMRSAVPDDALHAQLDRWREEWRPGAERTARERLLLEAVVKQQQIEAGEEEIEARLHQIAEHDGIDVQILRKTLGEESALRVARDQLLVDKALDFLASVAKVEEKTGS